MTPQQRNTDRAAEKHVFGSVARCRRSGGRYCSKMRYHVALDPMQPVNVRCQDDVDLQPLTVRTHDGKSY